MMSRETNVDIAIIGGGIAGLWLLNLLKAKGFSVALIENQTLGGGQTLASQGMIHGGIKYTLGGTLTNASETIAAMPARWEACLAGHGEIDLTRVTPLSRDYFLFSDSRLTSRVTALFGSKMIEGRVNAVNPEEGPAVFKNPAFKGLLYRLEDLVLDTDALISALTENCAEQIYTGSYEIEHSGGEITSLKLGAGSRINASQYVLAAGTGNGALIDALSLPVRMQRRPLNQIIISGGDLPSVFAHAITLRSADKPRLTITTHQNAAGNVWYLGGQLAESGVERTDPEQISFARKELDLLFPWLDFSDCQFSCLRIDRAEASQADQARPDTPYVGRFNNILVCWPTKLTLAPMLGDMVLDQLWVEEGNNSVFKSPATPDIGLAPWHTDYGS